MNVMVIDDRGDILMFMQMVLHCKGHSCDIFTCPKDAVKQYSKERYDVVITDYQMPGMNGLEVIEQLRSKCDRVPVIIMSGDEPGPISKYAQRHGCEFLAKPIDIDHFAQLLDKLAAG